MKMRIALLILPLSVFVFLISGYVGTTMAEKRGPAAVEFKAPTAEFVAPKATPLASTKENFPLGEESFKVGITPQGIIRVKISKNNLAKNNIELKRVGNGKVLVSISGILASEALLNSYGIFLEADGISVIESQTQENVFSLNDVDYVDVHGLAGYLIGAPFVQLP